MPTLIGHSDAFAALKRNIQQGKIAHAYLITGARGIGRRTFAMLIAKALNCDALPEARPCDQCRSCRLTERGVHPDVVVVKRDQERKVIITAAVMSIPSDAYLRPADGRAKVYVILDAETLNSQAANRLLKVLEEPPPYVTILLVAPDTHAVLPTIASRCQEIHLTPLPRSQLAAALVDLAIAESGLADRIAALSDGRPGWAVAAARDPTVLSTHDADVAMLSEALHGTRLQRLVLGRTMSEQWAAKPDAIRSKLRTWMTWWRDVQLVQLHLTNRVAHTSGSEMRLLQTLAQHLSPVQARIERTRAQQALADLESYVNPRLVLDLLVLQLPLVAASGEK